MYTYCRSWDLFLGYIALAMFLPNQFLLEVSVRDILGTEPQKQNMVHFYTLRLHAPTLYSLLVMFTVYCLVSTV